MKIEQLKPNVVVRGPIFPEPVQVIVLIPMGQSVKLIGKGLTTGQVHEPILNAEQVASLVAAPDKGAFDGDSQRFRLGVEALRLGLAYEYDPYFALSIARVDPLPHQLEAVYDYFLQLPRIRFLLADDPGAGKTIMAGLLIKELKIRGLIKRTLIVTPASLSFQWQREIPWNPMRLEQRMGRIHRYGQEKDCLILNFVSTNTREGRVLQKLFERIRKIEDDLDPKRTGTVFNVLGDVFSSNQLERMVRDMYARNLTEEVIKSRIVEQVDTDRFRKITHSALEGLAKRELNLSAILGKSAEAKERRLVPEVVEDFFLQAAPVTGLYPKEVQKDKHIYRIGRVPRTLWPLGERLESRFGKLGREYKQAAFDKRLLTDDPTLEWITPGHALFECVREDVWERVQDDLSRGTVFFDINAKQPGRLDVFSAAIRDGSGNVLHRRLFVVQTEMTGAMTVRQPTLFLDLVPSQQGSVTPDDSSLPDLSRVEHAVVEDALRPFLEEISVQREKEISTIAKHVEISLNALIDRQNLHMAELLEQQQKGDVSPLLAANIKKTEDRLDELNGRLERRRVELKQERHCTISDIRHHGRAWVFPHPERMSPGIAPMVRDEEIERIAVQAVIAHEEARGWKVESVEKDNRGFDLISRKPHPEDPQTAIEVRFIEVKGRAAIGEIALSSNEYKTAERLKRDYWLYAVFDCASTPSIHIVQDPERLGWEPIARVEHYHASAELILRAAQ